jgi:hypothetical protein
VTADINYDNDTYDCCDAGSLLWLRTPAKSKPQITPAAKTGILLPNKDALRRGGVGRRAAAMMLPGAVLVGVDQVNPKNHRRHDETFSLHSSVLCTFCTGTTLARRQTRHSDWTRAGRPKSARSNRREEKGSGGPPQQSETTSRERSSKDGGCCADAAEGKKKKKQPQPQQQPQQQHLIGAVHDFRDLSMPRSVTVRSLSLRSNLLGKHCIFVEILAPKPCLLRLYRGPVSICDGGSAGRNRD